MIEKVMASENAHDWEQLEFLWDAAQLTGEAEMRRSIIKTSFSFTKTLI